MDTWTVWITIYRIFTSRFAQTSLSSEFSAEEFLYYYTHYNFINSYYFKLFILSHNWKILQIFSLYFKPFYGNFVLIFIPFYLFFTLIISTQDKQVLILYLTFNAIFIFYKKNCFFSFLESFDRGISLIRLLQNYWPGQKYTIS